MRYLRNVLDRKTNKLDQKSNWVVLQYIQADDDGVILEITDIFSDGTTEFKDGRAGFIGLEGVDLQNGFKPWAWPDGQLSGQMYECSETEYLAILEMTQKLLNFEGLGK